MSSSIRSRVGIVAAVAFVSLCVPLVHAPLVCAQSDELLVYQVQAAQLPGTARVDVWYKLHTVDGGPAMVSLFLSTDGGITYPYVCQSVSGDVGPGVLPGTDRHLVWAVDVDLPGLSSATCRLRVIADDAPNLDDYVYVAPGVFTMGSPTDEPGRNANETQHQVTLTHGFYAQTTEVTNQQYLELVQWAYDHNYVTASSSEIRDNLDGSTHRLKQLGLAGEEITFSNGVFSCINPNHPVKYVTWYGAAAYCDWLSLKQGLARAYDHTTWQCNGGNPYPAAGYRLPTEAEWEFTCRAGSMTAFANGPITNVNCAPVDPNLDQMGWYCGNSLGWTSPVAAKLPNAWGLYDMHGNLNEYCNDWYAPYGGTVTDPAGPEAGTIRVCRGGRWHHIALLCRSALRDAGNPSYSTDRVSFRSVRSVF